MWPNECQATHIIQQTHTHTTHCIDLNQCRIAETTKQGDKRIIVRHTYTHLVATLVECNLPIGRIKYKSK